MQETPVKASDVAAGSGQTVYPAEFAQVVAGRSKRKLGELFGLRNFGVNLTTLAPGAASALFHCHRTQDEFVFILEGSPTLLFGEQVTYPRDDIAAEFLADGSWRMTRKDGTPF